MRRNNLFINQIQFRLFFLPWRRRRALIQDSIQTNDPSTTPINKRSLTNVFRWNSMQRWVRETLILSIQYLALSPASTISPVLSPIQRHITLKTTDNSFLILLCSLLKAIPKIRAWFIKPTKKCTRYAYQKSYFTLRSVFYVRIKNFINLDQSF